MRSSPDGARGSVALAGLAIVVVAAISRIASYRVPIERDTGQMLYGGGIVLDGDVPYVDAALNKGPATYVSFALVRLLTGDSVVALRILLLLAVLVTATALALYVRQFAGDAAAALTGLVFAALAPVAALQGDDPNLAQFGIAPMAIALALSARPGRRAAVATGVAGAFAGLLSPAFLIPLVPAAVITMCADRRDLAARISAAAAGGLVLTGLVVAWLALEGALDDLFDQVPGTWHQEEVENGPGLFDLDRLADLPARGLYLLALVACVVAARRRALRWPSAAAATWIVLSWLRIKVGDYAAGDAEHPHHGYPVVLGAAVALALGIASLWPVARWGRIAVAVVVLAAPLALLVYEPQVQALRKPVAQRGVGGIDWGVAYPVATFIRQNTSPSDRILVAGSNPEVYWLADRRAPTRFFDIYPILARASYGLERARDLREARPVAVSAMDDAPIEPELEALLADEYRLAYSTPQARVWLRKAD